ncbi:MAG: tetratricopeptide repeat protein [Brevefilum sp.]
MSTSLQQGINAAKAGQTTKALDHLKDAIIEEPQNANVWVWIAAIIDDVQKQEIFLRNALEIDPHNIPAQRGLSYLQKRKQHEGQAKEETLSDFTRPISPFPKSKNDNGQQVEDRPDTRTKSDEILNLTRLPNNEEPINSSEDKNRQIPRLTTFEIVLLGVVVFVFAFIGLLASSSLFGFNLPWGLLTSDRPKLAAEPPYPGVFLYEDDIFFDLEEHEGPPVAHVGIPTSSSARPVTVFWDTDVNLSSLRLIHESGTYLSYRSFQSGSSANLIQPTVDLQNGLYCLRETHQQPPNSVDSFYCFQISLSVQE